MKKRYISVTILIVMVMIITTYGFMTIKKKQQAPLSNGFAVVELFTSEGCSSCPPADEAVARLLEKNMDNVYILAYHVDYWNKLGWKDPFSKAEYSQRQGQYSDAFNLGSVYTPQVIINGSTEFVGSDESKLNSVVKNDLQKAAVENINLIAEKNNNVINITYDISDNDNVFLNLALVQPDATVSVKRGENGGRTLHHVNIVRALKTIDAKGKGNLTMEIPGELSGNTFKLIAYTQSKSNFKILGASQKSF